MKQTQWTIAIVLALLIGLPMLTAQTHTVINVPTTTSVNGSLQINIPFDFNVGDKPLKAGAYVIAPSGDKALMFKGLKGNGSAVALINPVSKVEMQTPKLIFHKYGDTYFLTQAWLRNSDSGKELFVSPKEIQMARDYRQQQVDLQGK